MDQVKFFKGCLPQILLGPFLNTLSHMWCVARFGTILQLYNFKNAKNTHGGVLILAKLQALVFFHVF